MKHYLVLAIAIVALGAGCSTGTTKPVVVSPQPPNAVATSTELDLSNRGLTAIPSEVFSRTELVKLNLSNNKLTQAPPSQIGQLRNLTSLDLSNNALTGLPAELGQLTKLEVLNVANNRITGLPMEIGKLTKLRVFNISGNSYSAQDLEGIINKLPNTTITR